MSHRTSAYLSPARVIMSDEILQLIRANVITLATLGRPQKVIARNEKLEI